MFPPPIKEKPKLHQDDIMGLDPNKTLMVTKWVWRKHTSCKTGKEMLKVMYYGGICDPSVSEYFTIYHDGFAGQKAQARLFEMLLKGGINATQIGENPSKVAQLANLAKPPKKIGYVKQGQFLIPYEDYISAKISTD